VNAETGIVYPSFAMKIPLAGADASINLIVGKSFDSQRIANDPKGAHDYNFFRDDAKFPFSNLLPDVANSTAGRVFRGIFKLAHKTPNEVPIHELSKVMNKPAPRRLIFRAPSEVQGLMDSKTHSDERLAFAKIQPGSRLFAVYESSGLSDPGRQVGWIVTKTRFVASSFGDRNLSFRHERGGLKRLPKMIGVLRGLTASPRPQQPQPLTCQALF
jgi:hypothetical protein